MPYHFDIAKEIKSFGDRIDDGLELKELLIQIVAHMETDRKLHDLLYLGILDDYREVACDIKEIQEFNIEGQE